MILWAEPYRTQATSALDHCLLLDKNEIVKCFEKRLSVVTWMIGKGLQYISNEWVRDCKYLFFHAIMSTIISNYCF